MDIDGMVKVNGHCALVEIGEAGYYTLGPATTREMAEQDAENIRKAIAYAVKQHAATEATPGGLTVTFPLKPGQKVRVKKTGQVKTVTQLTASCLSDGTVAILVVCEANAVDYSHPPEDLEAIPKTALEVLEEVERFIDDSRGVWGGCSHADIVLDKIVLDKIAELKKELTDAP